MSVARGGQKRASALLELEGCGVVVQSEPCYETIASPVKEQGVFLSTTNSLSSPRPTF